MADLYEEKLFDLDELGSKNADSASAGDFLAYGVGSALRAGKKGFETFTKVGRKMADKRAAKDAAKELKEFSNQRTISAYSVQAKREEEKRAANAKAKAKAKEDKKFNANLDRQIANEERECRNIKTKIKLAQDKIAYIKKSKLSDNFKGDAESLKNLADNDAKAIKALETELRALKMKYDEHDKKIKKYNSQKR